jgi:hypothetical protein
MHATDVPAIAAALNERNPTPREGSMDPGARVRRVLARIKQVANGNCGSARRSATLGNVLARDDTSVASCHGHSRPGYRGYQIRR